MLIPTKFTRLEESTVFKMRCILAGKKADETVFDALNRTKGDFYDASEFMHALDILFVLNLLDVKGDSGVIKYA